MDATSSPPAKASKSDTRLQSLCAIIGESLIAHGETPFDRHDGSRSVIYTLPDSYSINLCPPPRAKYAPEPVSPPAPAETATTAPISNAQIEPLLTPAVPSTEVIADPPTTANASRSESDADVRALHGLDPLPASA